VRASRPPFVRPHIDLETLLHAIHVVGVGCTPRRLRMLKTLFGTHRGQQRREHWRRRGQGCSPGRRHDRGEWARTSSPRSLLRCARPVNSRSEEMRCCCAVVCMLCRASPFFLCLPPTVGASNIRLSGRERDSSQAWRYGVSRTSKVPLVSSASPRWSRAPLLLPIHSHAGFKMLTRVFGRRQEVYGSFFRGDSYICMHTKEKNDGGGEDPLGLVLAM
jgi:hypothetical protein